MRMITISSPSLVMAWNCHGTQAIKSAITVILSLSISKLHCILHPEVLCRMKVLQPAIDRHQASHNNHIGSKPCSLVIHILIHTCFCTCILDGSGTCHPLNPLISSCCLSTACLFPFEPRFKFQCTT